MKLEELQRQLEDITLIVHTLIDRVNPDDETIAVAANIAMSKISKDLLLDSAVILNRFSVHLVRELTEEEQ